MTGSAEQFAHQEALGCPYCRGKGYRRVYSRPSTPGPLLVAREGCLECGGTGIRPTDALEPLSWVQP